MVWIKVKRFVTRYSNLSATLQGGQTGNVNLLFFSLLHNCDKTVDGGRGDSEAQSVFVTFGMNLSQYDRQVPFGHYIQVFVVSVTVL